MQTRDVRFVDGKIKIARAEIETPGNWGGLGTDIYDITIDGNGKISVGGGKFNLPTIEAGGLNLMSLEGVLRETSFSHTANGLLRPAAAGYEIQASGEFAVPGMGGGGACSIMVDVTIYVNSLGANVLELAPVEPATGLGSQQADAVDGFGLRQVTVGLHCLPGVPLGNTGFFITGVQGSITLHDRVESVSLKMWIEHATRIGNASLLSTDPQLTLYFSPFAIDFTAGLRVLNIKVAETGVHIDKNHFSTHISYDFLIIHGYTSLSAGTYNGKKYIAGSGKTSVGISKGRIWKKCVLGVCVKIPPWTINLGSIGIDFGTFKNGKFGVKGSINVFGWKGGVFVGFDGTVKFGKLNDYQLVGSQRVRQARVAYLMRRQGESPQAPLDPDISFAPNGDTLVHVSIPSLAGQDAGPEERDLAAMLEFAPLMPGDVISTVSVLRSDVIFALAQEPGGELAVTLMEPDGDPITPDALPPNVEYVQTIGAEEIQSTYFVEYAAAGDWQVRIIGDTDSTDFTLAVIGNTPPPAALAAIGATGPTTATVAWIAQVAVTETSTASLYAHSGPLTRTVTYTDSTGVLITETEQVVAWQADAHPDALTYTLHLATQHSLTPTLQTTRVFLAPTTPITVPAGQAAYAPLTLFIPDNIPFPLALSPGYIAAPDGFILGFTPEVITATGTVTPSVRIEAVSGMYTGTYAVPVLAQSGALEHTAVLEVKVVEADYGLYLPVVLR